MGRPHGRKLRQHLLQLVRLGRCCRGLPVLFTEIVANSAQQPGYLAACAKKRIDQVGRGRLSVGPGHPDEPVLTRRIPVKTVCQKGQGRPDRRNPHQGRAPQGAPFVHNRRQGPPGEGLRGIAPALAVASGQRKIKRPRFNLFAVAGQPADLAPSFALNLLDQQRLQQGLQIHLASLPG